MSDILKELQPRKVFEYFEAINQIPRGSGNEQAISDYLVAFAKNLGLEVKQDEANNVYIYKPATKGYEEAPTVILQGHMDMVCEKNKDVEHDFEKDGLDLYIDGDWIRARGTTLGGDDGIAIAYQMAILADDTLKHPALECFMTTDEERGMTGVAHMHPEWLSGKVLINVDNEVEGEFIVSCAGGAKVYLTMPYTTEKVASNSDAYRIIINGLKGGHSGAEIHLERANAHLLMGRLLAKLDETCTYQIVHIEGGSKDNVITRECEVLITLPKEQKSQLNETLKACEEIFKAEYKVQDPDIQIHLVEATTEKQEALSTQCKDKLIQYLLVVPNGVMGYDPHMPGLVQTSLNLGILQMTEDKFYFASAIRSSVASCKENLIMRLKALSEVFGFEFEIKGSYPAWQYAEDSRMRTLAIEIFEKMYGKQPKVTAIHAGLECGFISEKCPGLDMLSIGPDMQHIHSPEEALSISSTARVYAYIVNLLENLLAY